MKKTLLAAILALTSASCVNEDHLYVPSPKSGVDTTYNVSFNGIKPKPAPYTSYSGIKVNPDTVDIPKATLKNIVDAQIATRRGDNGFSHNYQILLFDVTGKELVLATKKPEGVSPGSSYSISFLEFFPNQNINSKNFFDGFIKTDYRNTVISDRYYLPDVLFALEMPKNIQGVLTKQVFLGQTWSREIK